MFIFFLNASALGDMLINETGISLMKVWSQTIVVADQAWKHEHWSLKEAKYKQTYVCFFILILAWFLSNCPNIFRPHSWFFLRLRDCNRSLQYSTSNFHCKKEKFLLLNLSPYSPYYSCFSLCISNFFLGVFLLSHFSQLGSFFSPHFLCSSLKVSFLLHLGENMRIPS